MATNDTARVARSYFDVWTNRKGSDALCELMAEGFAFDSAMMRIEGRDQFLAGAGASGWPKTAVATLIAEAYDGEHGSHLYTGTNGDRDVKVAEHLIVRGGQLVLSEAVVGGAAFMAFMAG
jgi:hypothetical protein